MVCAVQLVCKDIAIAEEKQQNPESLIDQSAGNALQGSRAILSGKGTDIVITVFACMPKSR